MQFAEIIKKVSQDKRLIPDLMKSEKGNNFRAVSESAILDVINPILEKNGVFYTVQIKKSELQIREAYGSKGKKLQFIATVEIKLIFTEGITHFSPVDMETFSSECISTEAVGMGIDDNDKAMGKAYTYAIKYALLKLFRLRYGDDPDVKASEPLYLDKPKEAAPKEAAPKEEPKKEASHPKAEKKSHKELAMTEPQRDYILGLMDQKGIPMSLIMSEFNGLDPERDEYIPMKTARAMIKWLETQPDLPF